MLALTHTYTPPTISIFRFHSGRHGLHYSHRRQGRRFSHFCPVTTHWHTSRPLAFCPVTTRHTPSTPFPHTLPLPLPLFNFSRFFAYFNFSRYFSATFTPLEPPFLPTPFFTLPYTRALPFSPQEGPFHPFSLREGHFHPFSLGEATGGHLCPFTPIYAHLRHRRPFTPYRL
jgi:hypothetical protein